MLRIRLTRTGKKHQPTYRIVVAEHSAPIKGKFVEIVGYYLPTRKPKVLEVNADRIQYWVGHGAVASDTVHNLLVDKGVLTQKRNIKYAKVKAETTQKQAAPTKDAQAEVPVEDATESENTGQEKATEIPADTDETLTDQE